jgi:hypothetical protein
MLRVYAGPMMQPFALVIIKSLNNPITDSAEEPHFLFLIDAQNACDSNAKFAINKCSSAFIATREK